MPCRTPEETSCEDVIADENPYVTSCGPRVSNLRGFGYQNQDLTITKTFNIKEEIQFQLRADIFNLWNWHHFGTRFDTSINSPGFGTTWGASDPRFIQLGAKFVF